MYLFVFAATFHPFVTALIERAAAAPSQCSEYRTFSLYSLLCDTAVITVTGKLIFASLWATNCRSFG